MPRKMRVTVVRVPADRRSQVPPGHDLVPGADPYISSLMAKLDRSKGRLLRKTVVASAVAPADLPEDLYFGEDWGCDPSERFSW